MSNTIRRNWTRNELIVAFNLYLKIPFGKINYHNPLIRQLADVIGRSPSAIAWKLVNFASLDPTLQERNIKGASNVSALDKKVFSEFYSNWNLLVEESENAYQKLLKRGNIVKDVIGDLKGEYVDRVTKIRVNQSIFRDIILASYNGKCCVSGLAIKELLIASHIIPWAKDENNRLNPTNGLCLNVFHDKLFDCGFMTLDENYRVIYSKEMHRHPMNNHIKWILGYEGSRISSPCRFMPNVEFLEYHRNQIFRQ